MKSETIDPQNVTLQLLCNDVVGYALLGRFMPHQSTGVALQGARVMALQQLLSVCARSYL